MTLHWNLDLQQQAATAELQQIESADHQDRDHYRTLERLLPFATPGSVFWKTSLRYRLFNDLARVAAKLRLYPLAMRCYFNAVKHQTGLPGDSLFYRYLPAADSEPVALDSIVAAFSDGKDVSFYALLLEVKQPVPGKRKAFTHINNVGHTFITLLKYNQDGTIVCRSFGFYPRKKGILSATPFHPSAPAVVKDDARHEWDEAAGRLLSYRQFQDILITLAAYHLGRYHLNHNNCTDFGLAAAHAAGITVSETRGHWPFGQGNNPGSAGQSLLEGKVTAMETTAEGLFVMENVPGH